MKKLLIVFIIQHLSYNLFAQSGTMLPDGFIIPNAAVAGTCTVVDKGKLYYNTSSQTILVCDGTSWKTTSSRWDEDVALQTVSYSGKVGINTATPASELDIVGSGRVRGDLYATSGIGVGTTTGSSSFEVVDGDIAISSTADAKTWKYDYDDAMNALTLKENGVNRMVFANGGNIGIGSVVPTAKLSVEGTGNISGNLTVNNGKGIVRSITANALKTFITPKTITSMLITNNTCNTTTVDLTSAGFSTAPTAMIGNLISGTGNFIKLNISVQSTTTTSAVVRFCNNTDTNITLTNIIFNSTYIGQ